MRDPQERDLGLLVAFQDLTEVKALEEQLKRADRLAAVGRLASGLAHEIRNPLASISGSVQLLREDPGIGEENRRLMGIVIKEVDRLNLLLSDFLNFARPSPLQAESVDVAALFDELIDLLRAGGQAEGVCFERLYAAPVTMLVDRQKLRQALWDLLLNAVDATAATGTVRISVDAVSGEIMIEDSGAGIAPEATGADFRAVLHYQGSRYRARSGQRLCQHRGAPRPHLRRAVQPGRRLFHHRTAGNSAGNLVESLNWRLWRR